jgi:hypothetical protein
MLKMVSALNGSQKIKREVADMSEMKRAESKLFALGFATLKLLSALMMVR